MKFSVAAAATVLLPLLLIGWAQRSEARPAERPLSHGLRNAETYKAVREISKHAQGLQTDEDTSIRLMPSINREKPQDHLNVCCLHANILDFYLSNILCLRDDKHPRMHRLKNDLHRISADLQTQGCNVTHYQEHQHAVQFRQKLHKMGGERGINKAIGEIDILYSYLQEFCMHVKNSTVAMVTTNTTAMVTKAPAAAAAVAVAAL